MTFQTVVCVFRFVKDETNFPRKPKTNDHSDERNGYSYETKE